MDYVVVLLKIGVFFVMIMCSLKCVVVIVVVSFEVFELIIRILYVKVCWFGFFIVFLFDGVVCFVFRCWCGFYVLVCGYLIENIGFWLYWFLVFVLWYVVWGIVFVFVWVLCGWWDW